MIKWISSQCRSSVLQKILLSYSKASYNLENIFANQIYDNGLIAKIYILKIISKLIFKMEEKAKQTMPPQETQMEKKKLENILGKGKVGKCKLKL